MQTKEIQGSCLCQKVQFTVLDEFKYSLICHCSKCRRATGSAFKPFAGIETSKLKLHAATEQLLIFGEPSKEHDVHCKSCGSLLYSVLNQGKLLHITLGSLSESPSLRPSAHIFVGSKASWYEITDNLPQRDEF